MFSETKRERDRGKKGKKKVIREGEKVGGREEYYDILARYKLV